MVDKELLRRFADDEALNKAVREVLEKQFDTGSLQATDSDIVLGQVVRARLVGLKAIEDAWKEISVHKTPPPPVDKVNPAR